MSATPDAIEELRKLGPNAADRLARVRSFLAGPSGGGEKFPETAAEVERLEAKILARKQQSQPMASRWYGQ
jgi:hypothetical protein